MVIPAVAEVQNARVAIVVLDIAGTVTLMFIENE